MVYNILFGYAIARFSTLDMATGLLSISPGGALDMAILAPDLGGDSAIVALLHVCRQIV